MDGRPDDRPRVALVDLDAARLDGASGDVRLVVSDDRAAVPFRWAALAGVPRAGEIAALAETVVDVVLVADESPRADAASRLASALGARVVRVPARAGGGS